MSRRDDDAAEALARAVHQRAAEPRLEQPRTLAGGQVLTLRAALQAADTALSRIKVKGLTRAFAAEVHDARNRIDTARKILATPNTSAAPRGEPGASAVGGQARDQRCPADGLEGPAGG